MTTKEAAEALGVTVRRVQALIKAGKLKAERRGRDWWITSASVERIRERPVGRPKKG